MKITRNDIHQWENKYRLRFINSISGYKGAHLIGTRGLDQKTNLAIFNSIVHIGSNPPLLGFIMRPLTVKRDTYTNLLETGYFTINHVHQSFVEEAHYTSVKLPKEESEFDVCGLTAEYHEPFLAPFVKESTIKLGLQLKEDIAIQQNGTRLIIGEIQHVMIDEAYVDVNGQIDLEQANDVCVTGLNQYSSVTKWKNFPYARLSEMPDLSKTKRPDNVAFDEKTERYHSSILPYGTNIGAPSIQTSELSTWKNTSIRQFNHVFQSKIDRIKQDYESLIEEYETNELLYKASMNFEPIIGKTYHLYKGSKAKPSFLSLIPPKSWKREHLGSFQLTPEKVWVRAN